MGGAHREWGVDPQGQCWGLQKLPWSVTGIDVFCFVADFIISHNIVEKVCNFLQGKKIITVNVSLSVKFS